MMIVLDIKAESKASSPIGLATNKEASETPTLSFSELLKGVKDSKGDKDIQNGSFLLALGETKETIKKDLKLTDNKETLLSLLKQNNKYDCGCASTKSVETLAFNPKVVKNMSTAELKILIADAKQFLKNKIITSDDFQIAKVKDLPKTLKGLSVMAKSLGIDMSKITLEEVKGTLNELPIAKILKQALGKHQEIENNTLDVKESIKEDVKVNDKRADIIKEAKSTPLFKATQMTDLTTEQIVQTKQFRVEGKTLKSKADETLKLLLRGEKPTNVGVNATADFSVATARVLAPSATTVATKSLEQLLHGAPDEATSKIDGLSTHKADSFEVKLNEAKQMIKYLSGDVKTAIEDYKSPFSRLKIQLNPAKMGEVDITIVSRGKNLHVNISSNTVAINTLAMNANELKTQLSSNGIQNATLNFNNSEQNTQQQTSQQQQNRQNGREADEEYSYFDNEEQNEEVLSSLEIVVPSYA